MEQAKPGGSGKQQQKNKIHQTWGPPFSRALYKLTHIYKVLIKYGDDPIIDIFYLAHLHLGGTHCNTTRNSQMDCAWCSSTCSVALSESLSPSSFLLPYVIRHRGISDNAVLSAWPKVTFCLGSRNGETQDAIWHGQRHQNYPKFPWYSLPMLLHVWASCLRK